MSAPSIHPEERETGRESESCECSRERKGERPPLLSHLLVGEASGGPRGRVDPSRGSGAERRETTSPLLSCPARQGCSSQPSVGAADGRDGGADLVPGRRRRRCGGGGAGRIDRDCFPVDSIPLQLSSAACACALGCTSPNFGKKKRCSKKKYIRVRTLLRD